MIDKSSLFVNVTNQKKQQTEVFIKKQINNIITVMFTIIFLKFFNWFNKL